MIVHPNMLTSDPKPCRLSDNDNVTCVFLFMTMRDIGKKFKQYFENRNIYLKISWTKFDMLMWYTYAFYGPNILNIMLDYREVAAWIIIWVLVMIVVLTAEAWCYPDHIVFYVLTLVLFLSYFHVTIANSFVDALYYK